MSEADRQPDWAELRALVAVMRHGSLSAAARHLGLTQPTLGRQIRALERRVGEALFDRLPSGLRPTQRALALFEPANALDEAAAKLAAALARPPDAATGTVRITASEGFAARVLAPILTGLAEAHPGIEIELSATNEVENLLRRDADIAVRHTRPAQQELIAQRLGTVEVGLFAARGYVARHGMPRDVRTLAGHRLIGPDKDPRGRQLAERWGLPMESLSFALRTDSLTAQEAAVRAGFGIGVMSVAEAEPGGELLRVFPETATAAFPIWLAAHADMRQSPRLRVVYDALVSTLRARFG
ncbi:LysR family transcriptional regulator [Sediminicoccus sp. BL-A-41-H5]|uniref:LysR family transcriptional regulator n=1 Tax=Sediminicoccus sp. BL-A-41-H5 TaxID=3421106 RepID=UPI003D674CF6